MPHYLEDAPDTPFVLVLGTRKKPHQTYAVIGGVAQETQNLMKAVDVAFKMLIYILDIEYPWQCGVTWEFFQKVVYTMDGTKKNRASPAIAAIRAALKWSDLSLLQPVQAISFQILNVVWLDLENDMKVDTCYTICVDFDK